MSETLEFLVFSGAYDEVLARTAQGHAPADAPAVIGALSFSGRLDEAESAFLRLLASGGPLDCVVQARFFLTAGWCHAGHTQKALRLARDSLPQVFDPDPRLRFWACQGLALVRFFEGRFRRARGFARRALGAAALVAFPYARFLALDLLAHVSLHTGEVFAGLRLLSQAESLAQTLGYLDNAATERTAAAIFQLRMLLSEPETAIARVEAVVLAEGVSYFTRRNGLVELATMFALRGARARADEALEEARRIALPGSDRRGKTRWLIGHALCTALARGASEARASLDEARASAGDELTLLAEIGFVQLVFFGERAEAAVEALRRIAETTGIQRARIACELASGQNAIHPPRVEDGLARLLLECRGRPAKERVERVIAAGLSGLVAWALEREPGRRIIVLGSELITENAGSVTLNEVPNRPALKLLLALRHGYRSRAQLIEEVWAISRFVPARHTAVLHTAVSRLRVALGEPDWIVTYDDGYALAEAVEVVNWPERPDVLISSSPPAPPDDRERVLDFVARHAPVSSADVSKQLKLSASTALRLLRRLADDGLLVRIGGGRATRYERG